MTKRENDPTPALHSHRRELPTPSDDPSAQLAGHLIWRAIEQRGWTTVRTRDAVDVLALGVMLAQGTVTARETSPGLFLVEAPIVTDETEDEREARLAVEAREAGTYEDGSVRVWGGP